MQSATRIASLCAAGSGKCGQVSDKHDRADGTGEILRNNGDGEHCRVGADHRQSTERQIGDGLQNAADSETGGKRKGARNEAPGKAAQQKCGQPDALYDRGVLVTGKTKVTIRNGAVIAPGRCVP